MGTALPVHTHVEVSLKVTQKVLLALWLKAKGALRVLTADELQQVSLKAVRGRSWPLQER